MLDKAVPGAWLGELSHAPTLSSLFAGVGGKDALAKLLALAVCCHGSPAIVDFPSGTRGPNKLFQKVLVMAFYHSNRKGVNTVSLGRSTEAVWGWKSRGWRGGREVLHRGFYVKQGW